MSLKFVAEMQGTGMPINAKMIQLEAVRINCSFCNKSNHAKKSIVERFYKAIQSHNTTGHMNPK